MRSVFDHEETVGALIARTRHELGISQLRLADRLCASAGTVTVTRHEVSRWEREERLPSPYWLGWLALALEVPVERLERAVAAPAPNPSRRQRRPGRPSPTVPPGWAEQYAGVYVRLAG